MDLEKLKADVDKLEAQAGKIGAAAKKPAADFEKDANLRESARQAMKNFTGTLKQVLMDFLHERKYAKATVARRLAAVRTFGKFLCRQGVLATNPADALRGPRPDRKLPHFLTTGDIGKLLSAPSTHTKLGRRDHALLEVLYSAGLRVSELCGLNTDDLDLPDGICTVRGKGKKERLALLGDQAVAALRTWLADQIGRAHV